MSSPIYANIYVHMLESIVLDLLDGSDAWYEIQENTGLPDERCKEIEELYKRMSVKYYPKK